MVVRHHELHPVEPARLEPDQKSFQLVALSRLASSTASTLRRPSQSTPIATCTARERITPPSRTFS